MSTNLELHVVFGAGPLGMSTARALLARGRRVRVVNRSGAADAPVGVEVTRGDATNPNSVAAVSAGAAVVYQCAQPLYHKWAEQFPALQAGIVEGAAAVGAKLVVGDNLYMYGEVVGPITEDLPNNATTRKGRLRAQMSEALLAAHRAGNVRVAIGRGSDFFGPGVRASMLGERVFANALQGKPASGIGNLDLPHTYTFIDDFGETLAVLGERDEALGQIWHVPNAETITTRQIITVLFEEIGAPPKVNSMGRLMMMLGGLFIPEARETVEMMYEFERAFIVDSSKFVRTFGNHATPLREAIRQTVAWYRQHDESRVLNAGSSAVKAGMRD
jgi:nucleoside-diphosphate-sugar epimerase